MLLDFSYNMRLDFSLPVKDQHFSMKCVPRDTCRQELVASDIKVCPDTPVLKDTDGLGNHLIYGIIRDEHEDFSLTVSGQVKTSDSLYEEYEDPSSIELVRYKVPSAYTLQGPSLCALYREWSESAPEGDYDKLLYYTELVRNSIRYASGTTDVHTTAEEAIRLGSGVCQDYSHVLIAVLRTAGIPARYVTGLIPGEGESHAWVEANCLGYWYGIDPTNNMLINESYIKFSHGRDYEDCMISRGIFSNPLAIQTMKIKVNVSSDERIITQ